MALTSTLFTGLSGLDVNQTRLNVVGNNIANVNTVAFKSSRALFKPQFYVMDSGGSPATDDSGGANPSQRGLGAVVATIEKDFSAGSIEPTGKPTDLAIDGDGFFVVKGKEQRFTRDGSFVLNSNNELVTSAGDFVQGFGVDESNNIVPGRLQNITIPLGSSTSAKATENVTLEGNLNAAGEVATGASILDSTDMVAIGGGTVDATTPLTLLASAAAPTVPLFGATDTLALAGKKGGRGLDRATLPVTDPATSVVATLGDLRGFMEAGLGIDTNVPPTTNPMPGVAITTGATGVRLTLTANLGTENALDLPASAFTNQNGGSPLLFVDDPASSPSGESVNTSFVAYDSLGTPITVSVTAVLENKADTGNTWRFFASSADDTDVNLAVGNGTLTFDNQGKLLSSTGTTMSVDRTNTGSGTPLVLKLDFSSLTSLTDNKSQLVMTGQDGSPIGTLSNFSIGADGSITGSFSNGLTRALGQVAMATFPNQLGLVDAGGNTFMTGPNSGVPVVSAPLTLGGGSIRSGALELSNVDLSQEFINLIISSTGFTASSRVITTSDQLLTELLNSSR